MTPPITAVPDGQHNEVRSTHCKGRGHDRLRVHAWAVAALLMLLVYGCDDCNLEITTSAVPNGIVNVPYSFGLSSDCGGDSWFLASFDLPPGIGLQSDGDLVGVPSRAGVFSFTVGLVDFDSGEEAFHGYTLTVRPQLPTPFPTPSPTPAS